MVREAEQHKADDMKRREVTEARNAAESLIYDTEKNLGEFKDMLTDQDKEVIEKEIENTKTALETDNLEEIKAATKQLSDTNIKRFESAYKNKAQQRGASSTSSEEEDTKDAEYKDKK